MGKLSRTSSCRKSSCSKKSAAPAKSAYQLITDRMIELLDQGVIPWHRPWSRPSENGPIAQTSLTTGQAYRGANQLLLGAMGFDSPYWVTFRKSLSMGGCVRKGEHGFPVVYWNVTKKLVRDPDTGKEEEKAVFFLRYYTVFNVAQIDPLDGQDDWEKALAKLPKPIDSVPTFEAIEAADKVVAAWQTRDCPPVFHRGDQACYRPILDHVMMPPRLAFESPEA